METYNTTEIILFLKLGVWKNKMGSMDEDEVTWKVYKSELQGEYAESDDVVVVTDDSHFPKLNPSLKLAVDMRIKNAALSDYQYEGIIRMHMAHESPIPYNGDTRRAFLLADSTGTGKGRQLAGFLTFGLLLTHEVGVWVSIKDVLYNDVLRDLRDLNLVKINSYEDGMWEGDGDKTNSIDVIRMKDRESHRRDRRTILFGVYQDVHLISNQKFSCIVFDECQQMKNPEAKQSKYCQTLLDGNKMSRVVFASATPFEKMTDVKYLNRILPHVSFAFSAEKNTATSMEVLQRYLTSKGCMICRTLSTSGVQFTTETVRMTPLIARQYRYYAHWYTKLITAMVEGKNSNVGTVLSDVRNLFGVILASLKTDTISDYIRNKHGSIVVMSNTGEVTEAEQESSFHVKLEKYLDHLQSDDDQKDQKKDLRDIHADIPYLQDMYERYFYIFAGGKRIEALVGMTSVWVTGWNPLNGERANDNRVQRRIALNERARIIKDFSINEVDILLLGNVGSTGISLQQTVQGGGPRHMVFAQVNDNPITFMQTIGRVNRKRQTIAPVIVLMTIGVPCETYEFARAARKVKQLSGGTTGSSRSNDALGMFKEYPNLNNSFGRRALKRLFDWVGDEATDDMTTVLKADFYSAIELNKSTFICDILAVETDPKLSSGLNYKDLFEPIEFGKISEDIKYIRLRVKHALEDSMFKHKSESDVKEINRFLGRLKMLPFGYQVLVYEVFRAFYMSVVADSDDTSTPRQDFDYIGELKEINLTWRYQSLELQLYQEVGGEGRYVVFGPVLLHRDYTGVELKRFNHLTPWQYGIIINNLDFFGLEFLPLLYENKPASEDGYEYEYEYEEGMQTCTRVRSSGASSLSTLLANYKIPKKRTVIYEKYTLWYIDGGRFIELDGTVYWCSPPTGKNIIYNTRSKVDDVQLQTRIRAEGREFPLLTNSQAFESFRATVWGEDRGIKQVVRIMDVNATEHLLLHPKDSTKLQKVGSGQYELIYEK